MTRAEAVTRPTAFTLVAFHLDLLAERSDHRLHWMAKAVVIVDTDSAADLKAVRLLEILATFEDYHMLNLRCHDVLVRRHQPLRSGLDR